jgi:hypothetical protein
MSHYVTCVMLPVTRPSATVCITVDCVVHFVLATLSLKTAACVAKCVAVCCSCHGLQAMGHRAPVLPDDHDAHWPHPPS